MYEKEIKKMTIYSIVDGQFSEDYIIGIWEEKENSQV